LFLKIDTDFVTEVAKRASSYTVRFVLTKLLDFTIVTLEAAVMSSISGELIGVLGMFSDLT
jgi:uncharacterized Tic20 family protein